MRKREEEGKKQGKEKSMREEGNRVWKERNLGTKETSS